jgi:hypothetical protein
MPTDTTNTIAPADAPIDAPTVAQPDDAPTLAPTVSLSNSTALDSWCVSGCGVLFAAHKYAPVISMSAKVLIKAPTPVCAPVTPAVPLYPTPHPCNGGSDGCYTGVRVGIESCTSNCGTTLPTTASTPTLTTIGPADAPTSSPSAAPTTADCKDRIFSGLETDLDCGGLVCSACRRAGAINGLYY